jgi:hypothetical protein
MAKALARNFHHNFVVARNFHCVAERIEHFAKSQLHLTQKRVLRPGTLSISCRTLAFRLKDPSLAGSAHMGITNTTAGWSRQANVSPLSILSPHLRLSGPNKGMTIR